METLTIQIVALLVGLLELVSTTITSGVLGLLAYTLYMLFQFQEDPHDFFPDSEIKSDSTRTRLKVSYGLIVICSVQHALNLYPTFHLLLLICQNKTRKLTCKSVAFWRNFGLVQDVYVIALIVAGAVFWSDEIIDFTLEYIIFSFPFLGICLVRLVLHIGALILIRRGEVGEEDQLI